MRTDLSFQPNRVRLFIETFGGNGAVDHEAAHRQQQMFHLRTCTELIMGLRKDCGVARKVRLRRVPKARTRGARGFVRRMVCIGEVLLARKRRVDRIAAVASGAHALALPAALAELYQSADRWHLDSKLSSTVAAGHLSKLASSLESG